MNIAMRRILMATFAVIGLIVVTVPVQAHHAVADVEVVCAKPDCVDVIVQVEPPGPGTCPGGIDAWINALTHGDGYCI